MRRKSYNIPAHAHFVTFSCYRRCQILASGENCALLAQCVAASRERIGFDLWAYVFMPDHVHLLIRPREQTYSMAEILKGIKGPFAKRFMAIQIERNSRWVERLSAGTSHRVWQRGGGFDRNLFSPDLILRAAAYIEHNPVRKGYIAEATDWRWSSAAARAGFLDVPLGIDPILGNQASKSVVSAG